LNWVTQLKKGLLEYCVLLILKDRESYGYEIVQMLEGVEGFSAPESTVYPILGRLKQDNCLKVRAVPSSSGPPRRYFSLSKEGELRLEEMRKHWGFLVKSLEKLERRVCK
jgi:PadR family transcriptional regulator, regulatory protein PadR